MADVIRAATDLPHTSSPGLPNCIPYGELQARTGTSERHGDRPAHRQCGIKEMFRHGARGREGRHAVRTRREWPASNSGVQRRLRLQKCKAFGVSFLFAPAGIFVHVCRRCQRADRAGGIHVGLIFCNFSIKRKVKDYNCLIDLYLPQCATSSLCMTLSNKEFLFSQSYLCHHVYNHHFVYFCIV